MPEISGRAYKLFGSSSSSKKKTGCQLATACDGGNFNKNRPFRTVKIPLQERYIKKPRKAKTFRRRKQKEPGFQSKPNKHFDESSASVQSPPLITLPPKISVPLRRARNKRICYFEQQAPIFTENVA